MNMSLSNRIRVKVRAWIGVKSRFPFRVLKEFDYSSPLVQRPINLLLFHGPIMNGAGIPPEFRKPYPMAIEEENAAGIPDSLES